MMVAQPIGNKQSFDHKLPEHKNLDIFNLCTCLIIGDLYSSFPMCVSLDKNVYFPVEEDPEIINLSEDDYVKKHIREEGEYFQIKEAAGVGGGNVSPVELIEKFRKEYRDRQSKCQKELDSHIKTREDLEKVYHPIFEQTVNFLEEDLLLIKKCEGFGYKLTANGYKLFASNQNINIDDSILNLLGIKKEIVSNGSLFQAICGFSKTVITKAIEKGTVEQVILPILGGAIIGATGVGSGTLAVASASIVGRLVESTLSTISGTAYAGDAKT